MKKVFLFLLIPFSLLSYELFPHPGIIKYREGKWVGSEHLFHLKENFYVTLEVVNPDNIAFSQDALKKEIVEELKKGKIIPQTEFNSVPPLPRLHFLFIIQSLTESHAVVYFSSRLFETIEGRVILPKGTSFQAITWENEGLSVIERFNIEASLFSSTDKLVKSFVDQYRHFNPPETKP